MKPEFSKFAFWAATAAGVVCVLMLAALTFQSLFRLFVPQPEKAVPAEITTPAADESPSSGQKSAPGAGEQPYANPAPVSDEFCTDSEIIRQKERDRQEIMNNPQVSGKNADSNAVPSKENLEQMEQARDI